MPINKQEELEERYLKKRIVGVLSDVRSNFLPDEAGYIILKNILQEKVDLALSKEKQGWIDNIMACIDGHYDNPNLAGELEDLMGITFKEWNEE